MKNRFLYILFILFVIIAGGFFFRGKTNIKKDNNKISVEAKNYNIVLISIDGLQAKHLFRNGYFKDETPSLNKFIDKSAYLKNAISPASWTVPAQMSVFTSMFPSEHRVVNKFVEYDKKNNKAVGANLQKLTPNATTITQVLKEAGYQTAGFTGDAGVSASFGFDAGFDTYYQTDPFKGFDDTMPRALDWLKKHRNGKFFLFLHGYDVHGQSEPKDGFDYRFVKNPYNGKYTGSKKEQGALREEGLKENSLALSEEDIAFWRAIYDEKINRMDEKFGNFMEEMQAMGLMENTIFIVFSDHGTEFMEHKKFDHGHSLYSELVDVFFAVYIPGQDGKIINELVSTLDIFPTLMGLLEKEPASIKQIKGVDLSAAIMGKGAVPQRNVFSETDYRLYTHKRSVQTPDGWKMILTMNDAGNEKELYNLKSDPDEKINLISAEARIGYELEQAIYIHLNKMKANGPWILGCLPVYGDQCQ